MVYNIDNAEYKVEYQGNTISAYSTDPQIVYQKGEQVYVLVPEGDFSQKKIILGRAATGDNTSYEDKQDMTNFYIEKGPNWLEWYPLDHTPMQICAVPRSDRYSLNSNKGAFWEDFGFSRAQIKPQEGTTRYPMKYPTQEELNEADAQLALYGKTYQYIKLSASFRTEFMAVHSSGEYALKVEVLVDNPKYVPEDHPSYNPDEPQYNTMTFELGFPQFSGAPYQFAVNTPQTAYYQVPVGTIKGLSRISLYQNGEFLSDVITEYSTDGTNLITTETPVRDKSNIFCDNLDIRFCDKINLTDTLYYCWIETPRGDKVYSPSAETPVGKDSVSLIAHLQYGYEDLVAEGTCEIKWFRQQVDVTHEYAAKYGTPDAHNKLWTDYTGPGWMPIEYYMQDSRGFYNVDYDTLTVRKEAVDWKWKYKVVVIYNDNVIATAEQEITRFDSQYDLTLEQFTSKDGKSTFLRIDDLKHSVHKLNPDSAIYDAEGNLIDGKGYNEWFGTWYLMLQDGSYTRVSEKYAWGPFDITRYALNEVMTFLVMCYDPYVVDPNNTHVASVQAAEVGNLTITINTTQSGNVMVEWIGKDVFNYDAQGSAYPWIGEQEYTLQPKLTWATGFASDYLLEVLAPDATILGSREYHSEGDELGSGYNVPNDASMMTDMWVDLDNVIHFRVREKYDERSLLLNTYTLRIKTLKGEVYTVEKAVSFIKDGDQGTQGSDWIAPIYPCNSKAIDKDSGAKIAPFMERNRLVNPLVLVKNSAGGYSQDMRYPLFIRPFVQKNGIPLENLDPTLGYYYKIWYDVRFSQNWTFEDESSQLVQPDIQYKSHLRMFHPDGTEYKWNDQGSQYQMGGQKPGPARDYRTPGDQADGMQGFGIFPSRSMAYANGESEYPATDPPENYGAIEIRYLDQPDLALEDTRYNFYVIARIDIYQGGYDEALKMICPYTNKGQLISTIYAWYPVDVFFNIDNIEFHPEQLYTNWPTHVIYNATGYQPNVNNLELKFYYGDKAWQAEQVEGNVRIDAINLTKEIQHIEIEQKTQYIGETDAEVFRDIQKYRPVEFMNWQNGMCGSLKTSSVNSPFKNGFYIRCQMFSLNQYGNVDANGWNGRDIVLDKERGTIFAPTVGAGYKDAFTNTFTGVIMGIDTSQTKEVWGDMMGFDADDVEKNPYMAGLYGYQRGVASFGLMENGTAFFGRADRGGRIIIDGFNASIYGGANGIFKSPEIGDPMWNAMRLNFVDLTHAVQEIDDSTYSEGNAGVGTDGINLGFGSHFYGDPNLDYGDPDREMPFWYAQIWRYAYVKTDNVLPYYLEDSKTKWGDLPAYPGPTGWDSSNPGCYRVNYYDTADGKAPDWITDVEENPELTAQRSLFGPSRASTTPAIEIGQHVKGLMPGIVPWSDDVEPTTGETIYGFESVLKNLRIPGDRNFMVTYDGTLWAMNGVFMGQVIGSNIIGGRIQGAEIGIGLDKGDYKVYDYYEVISDCNWLNLLAPIEKAASELHGDDENWFPPTAFYVDSEGNAWAKSLKIYGGLINIGHFHILPKDPDNPDQEGNLVQFGESDFIGPTHFYGNVGIGPDLSQGYGGAGGSNNGNLFLTRGFVGLGIPLPPGDTSSHIRANGSNFMDGPDEGYYATGFSIGDPKIGQRSTLQQTSFFGLDTRVKPLPVTGGDNGNYVVGHFWPLMFKYTETTEEVAGQSGATVAAYAQVMDIFRSPGFSVNIGGAVEEQPRPDINYFRIGPWGTEGTVHWFRKSWQNENDLTAPKNDGSSAAVQEYLGWLGVQDRAGYGTSISAQMAVGLTTWYSAPIIFNSDGESAWCSRGHFHFFINGFGSNAGTPMETWKAGGPSDRTSYGIVFNMGSNFPGRPPIGQNGSPNSFYATTGRGYFSFAVEGAENVWSGTWGGINLGNYIYRKGAAGFAIDPFGASDTTVGGVQLWTCEKEIHIARLGNNYGSHDNPHSELYMTIDSFRCTAIKALSFLLNVPPHTVLKQGLSGIGIDENMVTVVHKTAVTISAKTDSFQTDRMYFTADTVGFYGVYATPEKQFGIYARFA